ncbi:E3 ubiquitin-protein ligase SIAH1B-like [Saccopteryx leptura]|uniref:E3 ubiquitin-protein ligase SIAH1B-like n=1 Tax=Saccopteryx leptura TaxID=249018 RepID=UPI00339BE4C1
MFDHLSPETVNDDDTDSVASDINILKLFKCPMCLPYALPPICQCQNGHLLCKKCHFRVSSCPVCKIKMGSIRNLAVEKLSNNLVFPCSYTPSDCRTLALPQEKENHEKMCDFRPCVCPCPGETCKWRGNLNEVIPYLELQHNSVPTIQGENLRFSLTGLDLPISKDWVMVLSFFNQHFVFTIKKVKVDGQFKFIAISQIIGTHKEAGNFTYRVELSAPKWQLCWEATPLSAHDDNETCIKNSDCLMQGSPNFYTGG